MNQDILPPDVTYQIGWVVVGARDVLDPEISVLWWSFNKKKNIHVLTYTGNQSIPSENETFWASEQQQSATPSVDIDEVRQEAFLAANKYLTSSCELCEMQW